MNSWLRKPRTTQERRRACDKSEWEWTRGCRSWKRLVDAWDDIPTSGQKSWKLRRRTQYRVKNC